MVGKMNEAFYLNTIERINDAIKGSTTDEQKFVTLGALIFVTSTALLAIKGNKYNREFIDEIQVRVLNTNIEPTIIETVNNQGDLYAEIHTKIINLIKPEMLMTKDKYYAILGALSAIMARLLIAYKTQELDIEEERLFKVMNRLLDVNTD